MLRQELAANARVSELEVKLARRAWEDWRAGTAMKRGERAAAMAAGAAAGPAQEGGGIALRRHTAETNEPMRPQSVRLQPPVAGSVTRPDNAPRFAATRRWARLY